MKQGKKTFIWIIILIIVVVGSIFFIQMKKFANGVKEDANKKKDFKEKKLSDSTTIIYKKVE
ncbi:MAG: hypothetical protein JSS80_11125 [Bacteroidetes bacterium]|nr:hypothetical protein [Bacteroidota bacterium]